MELSIIFLPLIASIISGFFGRFIGDRNSEIITSLLVSISAILSIYVFYEVIVNNYQENILIAKWINSGSLDVNWSMNIDPLSSVMLVVVTLVSSLVHVYSIGYMSHDPHKPRFMAYLSLFTFAMLMLVTSDNFIQLFFGWEGVGLCSYFLIGFWFKKESANAAAIKAFVVNRVGDFGFALGIFLIFYLFGTVNYNEVFQQIPTITDTNLNFLGIEVGAINLICFLLFIGAMGKSAQILLHTWLPDAMEGPTPVSALIHAATMVTAGVFLVVRCSPIYEYSPLILNLITIIGMTTAFFAATVALVQTDIKKIIAYSTCSQLGYMFFAAGVGAYNVAMFHLFTHAFFKALLFLGSGSVIHAFKDEQNINNMGAVWKKLPYTYVLMIIGTLALTGFPFLSGFYSKDAIIEFAYLKGNTVGYYAAGVGVFTAFLTAIYSWRLIFKTFHGEYNNKSIKIEETHESPLIMLIPLIILSIGAIFAGFIFKDLFISLVDQNNFWAQSILFLEPLSTEHPPTWFLLITPILVLISIPIAYYLFVKNKSIPEQIVKINRPLYEFLVNKWYFDELYDYIIIKPSQKIGLFLWKVCDVKIIDGFGPDGMSMLIKKISQKANKFQSGFIYQYAFVMLLGFSALLTYLIIN
ncbi:MAG: NADH:ubiquinone oxidoreductase subunit L [Pelagibacteraceae bacterium BACL5 MAG-120705-bin12]|jgi:NADH-quinone oxidoreductase subunit L|uniref:NADH-quinone oxidoreductase subunit L n=1 Tax=Candidatus Pelagibacter sp. TaxID=2024849 RepID=UPI00071307AD|nr:MAG: NADH:ubiquinone oxidoreductase subunit L [Pelagibacteraceae bacterium BACL5 MAG-121015-bin10]KRO61296.1 MAG: NADH:ubiquinone oxidoreductase subunit L [Pelagibacteraceae bacterium BACL5 MAG-120705-bin12]KRO65393.1 MAG: NADH:ubiquinone oxidoreductase subunit L [Pelagibacteraceae bacterium BACL5 MAG-120820-bin39]